MKQSDSMVLLLSALTLALSLCALFQCPSRAHAQDAIILMPNGPVPMMHIPEVGTGAIPGGGLWIPMTSPSGYDDRASRDEEWRSQRELNQRQLDETRRALEEIRRSQPAYGSRPGNTWGR